MNTRFLLFGGAGFFGTRLKMQLAARNISVKIAQVDLRDRAKVRATLTELQPTHVLNAAARGVDPTNPVDLESLKAVNTQGPIMLQEECDKAGVKRFIHLGSCFEYGSHDSPIEESFPLMPTTNYARTKAEASVALLEYAAKFRCATLVLRMFGFWGPGEKPHRLVPQILRAYKERTPVKLTHGRQIRDFSFVDDVAQDVVLLSHCEGLKKGGLVNVGSGQGISVLDFAKSVAKILKVEDLLEPGALPSREGEMNKLVCSNKKLLSLIQRKPRTPLEAGLKLMK